MALSLKNKITKFEKNYHEEIIRNIHLSINI